MQQGVKGQKRCTKYQIKTLKEMEGQLQLVVQLYPEEKMFK